MAGLFESIQQFFGGSQPEATVHPAMAVPASAALPDAANDTHPEFSLTLSAQNVLTTLLRGNSVKRIGHNAAHPYPAAEVEFTSNGIAGGEYIGLDEASPTPKGEAVTMTVKLNRPATDFNEQQLKNALPVLLNAIPMLHGKIIAKAAQALPPTYKDAGKELSILLSKNPGKLSQDEIGVLGQFFEAHQAESDKAGGRWSSAISSNHFEGKVNVGINARELPGDKDATVSSDETIVNFFKAHQEMILSKVKEKALALTDKNGAPVLQPSDLNTLDMHATASGWSINLQLGTKAQTDVDANGTKLTAEQLAKNMTETPLAKIDTKQLDRIVTEALLESQLDQGQKLDPIMARIMDAPMLAGILRKKMPGNPEIEAFLAKHEMFMTPEQEKAKAEAVSKNNLIELPEAVLIPGKSLDGKTNGELTIRFNLPEGVTLQDLLKNIYENRAQMAQNMRQQPVASRSAA